MLADEIPVLDDGQLDGNVLAVLPDVETVLDVQQQHVASAWAKIFCITTMQRDGDKERYFMKIRVCWPSWEGSIESFCPKPIAWGTFQRNANMHFYLCNFYDFTEGRPDPKSFCQQLHKLHSHESPNGKFGFDCVTYNGDLPQDNTWFDSWEEFFANGLRHILRLREERAGPNPELDAVLPPLFEAVIPRLLRPLESNGRKVKPSLVHGDLWCGNASIVEDTGQGMVYDPASFWADNECMAFHSSFVEEEFQVTDSGTLTTDELGNWRPEQNEFDTRYLEAYHSQIKKSEPEENYDDRNALYALRFNLHAATLFPSQKSYVSMVIDEIKRLTERLVGRK